MSRQLHGETDGHDGCVADWLREQKYHSVNSAGSSFGTPAAVGRSIFTSWQRPYVVAVDLEQVLGSQAAVLLGADG